MSMARDTNSYSPDRYVHCGPIIYDDVKKSAPCMRLLKVSHLMHAFIIKYAVTHFTFAFTKAYVGSGVNMCD